MDRLATYLRSLPFVGRFEPTFSRFVGSGSLDEEDALAGLLRFIAMGLVSTMAYFLAALVLFGIGVKATTASLLAMLVGLAVSFIVQSRITFRRNGFQSADAVRFIVLGGVGLLLAHYAVVVVHDAWGQPAWQGAVVVCVAVPVVNFVVMNFWVFTHR